MSKPITAVAALALVDDGTLRIPNVSNGRCASHHGERDDSDDG